MGEPPAIAFDTVSKTFDDKTFDDGRLVLDQVSLAIPSGQFVALVGGSGTGKTTLLRLINRLIEATAGTVRVDGADVQATDPVALRRSIGYVFQGIGLFPHMTIAENIAVTPRLLGWDLARRRERVTELIRLVRLDPDRHRDRFPHQLSGGERQRVGVARALAAGPRIMLMDEPFGALDPLTRDALSRDYRGLHETLGLTTVMVTHDLGEALLIADRILVLQGGHVVADASPRALMQDEQVAYVRELTEAPRRQAERLRALTDGPS